MMRVTTWTEYSLIISVHLARRGGARPVAARELAEAERLPGDYVEQITFSGFAAPASSRASGVREGYFLAREADRISVRDVMTACEHQTFEINCENHQVDSERCRPDAQCSIRPVWQALQQRVDDLLASVSLADLMKQEAQVQEMVLLGVAG
jgi:Rrf2 family protein